MPNTLPTTDLDSQPITMPIRDLLDRIYVANPFKSLELATALAGRMALKGRRKYGTPLQAHNGRDPLVDAYQEALDLCVYLRQAIAERDGTTSRLSHSPTGRPVSPIILKPMDAS